MLSVISRDAYALERAKKAGISSEVLVPKDYEDRNAFGEAADSAVLNEQYRLIWLYWQVIL